VDDSSSGQSSHAGIIGLATAAVVLGIGAASLARRGVSVIDQKIFPYLLV